MRQNFDRGSHLSNKDLFKEYYGNSDEKFQSLLKQAANGIEKFTTISHYGSASWYEYMELDLRKKLNNVNNLGLKAQESCRLIDAQIKYDNSDINDILSGASDNKNSGDKKTIQEKNSVKANKQQQKVKNEDRVVIDKDYGSDFKTKLGSDKILKERSWKDCYSGDDEFEKSMNDFKDCADRKLLKIVGNNLKNKKSGDKLKMEVEMLPETFDTNQTSLTQEVNANVKKEEGSGFKSVQCEMGGGGKAKPKGGMGKKVGKKRVKRNE